MASDLRVQLRDHRIEVADVVQVQAAHRAALMSAGGMNGRPHYDGQASGRLRRQQCPARAQWDTVRPCEPASPFLQRLFTRGRDFESEVVAQLLELHPDALTVTQRTPQNTAERDQETLQAMRDRVPLILGGRLPAAGSLCVRIR
jgi:hypothetical protein